ncbi:hypothetical protein ASD65_07240 [Microbacterium sp. Root61]|uniref:signal peptidase I n=1 Tax=Microbacterium sp. Root61 TaxID=1736570 RepID=UPI0006F33F81|nr:signal peptidase I [Microbacterium sp. Root61]KRA24238.1 hypothetical protein ASD65_07240 [Microbacterium sp. Root61]
MALAVPATVATQPTAPRTRRRGILTLSVIVAPLLLAALAVAGLGAAHIVNDSMDPTLRSGDVVLYDRWLTPARGDIVLFRDVDGWSGADGTTLVKRVIGVGGDTVVCCEAGSGRLLVNGEPLDEGYIAGDRPGGVIPFRVSVPDGSVWVVGDNRAVSVDSRSAISGPHLGAVALDDVLGIVRGRVPQ